MPEGQAALPREPMIGARRLPMSGGSWWDYEFESPLLQRGVTRELDPEQPGQEETFIIRNLAEVAGVEQSATDVLSMLLAAVASVSLSVGGIGVMNIMLVSGRAHPRDWIEARGWSERAS